MLSGNTAGTSRAHLVKVQAMVQAMVQVKVVKVWGEVLVVKVWGEALVVKVWGEALGLVVKVKAAMGLDLAKVLVRRSLQCK
jgi:hypothetical protein